jgi:hypothetical protein
MQESRIQNLESRMSSSSSILVSSIYTLTSETEGSV